MILQQEHKDIIDSLNGAAKHFVVLPVPELWKEDMATDVTLLTWSPLWLHLDFILLLNVTWKQTYNKIYV